VIKKKTDFLTPTKARIWEEASNVSQKIELFPNKKYKDPSMLALLKICWACGHDLLGLTTPNLFIFILICF
jgi:hypothetical protein